jgi:hypothetical protein
VQIAALNSLQIAKLTSDQIMAIELGDLRGLTSTQLKVMTTDQVRKFTTDQIVAFSTTQVGALTTDQVKGLSTDQLAAIETRDFAVLTAAQLKVIASDNIASLTTDQVAGLTSVQLAALTTDQVTGLTAQAKKTENLAKYQALQAYFKMNYNENTKMRDYYFKETDKLNIILNEQEAELLELATAYNSLSTQASTDYRRLKDEKYKLAEQDYYYHLYIVSGLAQLIILAVLGLAWSGTLPFLTGAVVLVVILVCLMAYIVYYVYFKFGERDLVTFDKYRFPIKGDTIINAKSRNKTDAERRAEKEIADKVSKLITDNSGKCPA